jgi:1-acyl-sn-glycerol-3-phosphate acyltransferase
MQRLLKLFFYYFMKYYMQVFIRLFFGRVEIVGKHKIPKGKPIIYSCNHQNAFMDALIIGALSPVRITSMTRSDVFHKTLSWFMDALQMLPIYRMRDGIDQLAKNEAVFEKIRSLLRDNRAILIFSEGNHGNDYFLRPLTKGSSRMAFEAMEKMPEKDIQIVPIGLNYFHHQRPGHKLTVVFGDGIPVKNHFPSYEEHPVRGANLLKKEIAFGMRECLLIPEETEDYEERRAYINRQNERIGFHELRKRINLKDHTLKKKSDHVALLNSFGKALGIFNFPPLLLLQKILAPIKDIVFYSSLKYAFGLFVFQIWYLIVLAVAVPLLGWKMAGLIVAMLFLALLLRLKVLRWANPPH